jgi:diguanylate cyclase (GGDEF)-like protein/PAS domain S-box-containing protein
MQGSVPVVDAVRLVLLILFLGIQRRRRPHSYVGFWFAGWICVLLSYIVWAVGEVRPELGHLKDAAYFDFMLLGVLTFLMSQVAKEQRPRKIVLVGAAIGLVNVFIINMQEFAPLPRVLLVLMVLLWQGDSFYIAHMLLPRTWRRRRAIIFTICVVFGAALLRYVWMTPAGNLGKFAVMEVLLCAAVLYADTAGIRNFARCMGVAGFVLWAAYYVVNIPLIDQSQAQKLLYEFRNFPKYFVAFMMMLKIFEDETADQARLAEKFRELYAEFRLIYETHPHPMWICDVVGGRFITANEATLRAYGYALEELQEMQMADLEAPMDEEAEDVESVLGAPIEGTRMQHRHKDGRVVWVNVVDHEMMYQGQEARFVIARNITERLKMDRELSHRAQHDALTGLPNRQLLAERLEQCLNTCEREQRKVALFTIDVDHFKLINDTYGHMVGDECLVEVAARLKSKIRKVDTIARTGGEEFTAIVSGLSRASDAEKVAASLLRVFEAPVELAMGALWVTVSIGVAVFPDGAEDAETLRQLSDEAMYRAKRAGRNRAAYAFDADDSVGIKVRTISALGGESPAL